jgi:predicted transcriptional regulator
MTKTASKPEAASGGTATAVAAGKPARMVRKQILLTPEQSRKLKALAVATGRTEADLFREAIDAKLASAGEVDWKVGFFAAVAEWPEDSDIGERIAENRKAWARRHKRFLEGGDDK